MLLHLRMVWSDRNTPYSHSLTGTLTCFLQPQLSEASGYIRTTFLRTKTKLLVSLTVQERLQTWLHTILKDQKPKTNRRNVHLAKNLMYRNLQMFTATLRCWHSLWTAGGGLRHHQSDLGQQRQMETKKSYFPQTGCILRSSQSSALCFYLIILKCGQI